MATQDAADYQPPAKIERGLMLAQRAVELYPHLPDARVTLAHMLRWLHRAVPPPTLKAIIRFNVGLSAARALP